jgi:hypothetical protein
MIARRRPRRPRADANHASVLTDDGLDRELAYTALSRGRHTNGLYLTRRQALDRAQYAPVDDDARDPLERLTAALRTSSAQSLAIDSGTDDVGEQLADAERTRAHAVARHRAAEEARFDGNGIVRCS